MEFRLITACGMGNIKLVEDILSNNRFEGQIYMNALTKSCEYDRKEIFEYLLKYCKNNNIVMDIHMYDEYLFLLVCEKEDIDMLRYLITYCTDIGSPINIHVDNENAFRRACSKGNINVIKFLLEYGRTINSAINIHILDEDVTVVVCCKNNYDILKYLFEYSKKYNDIININTGYCRAFQGACRENNIKIIKSIVEYGELINNKINAMQLGYIIDNTISNKTDIIQYIVYLYKHNYIMEHSKIYIMFSEIKHSFITKKKLDKHCYVINNNYDTNIRIIKYKIERFDYIMYC